jgi:CheY-like chemotaxis protein
VRRRHFAGKGQIMGKILVIDDEEIIRIRLKDLLVLDDYEAFAAGSGTEGLELFARERPDIVIVDLRMPDMDGLEVLRRIKAASEHTEVIIVTGHGGVETAIEAMKMGAFSYLQKPLEYDELLIEINRIYEKIALTNKVERYVHDLERAVGERDIELENRRKAEENLREAIKVAESANKAKSMFLAHMSHEIRTPLHGIIGFAELLNSTALTSEQRFHLDRVHSCGATLLTIVNDILDFSKIESNKITLEEFEFDLLATLGELERVLSIRASQKKLTLTIAVKPNIPTMISGDPFRLRQIVFNLMANALKFTEAGSVSLDVGLDKEDDISVTLRFVIRDTGIGIAPEYIPTLFSPFEQGDKSTTRKFGGTGLGLVISKQLTEKMGGQIGVESTLGQGSTFWFTVHLNKKLVSKDQTVAGTLPEFAVVSIDNTMVAQKPITMPAVADSPKTAKHILVAEDNPDNQTLVLAFLKKLGYTADVVCNGLEAIKTLETKSYDLIVMDCQMPEMDGFTATCRIREAGSNVLNPQIPIVAMTASASKEDREACLKAGMNDYLSKPVSSKKLGETLKHWLFLEAGNNPGSVNTEVVGEKSGEIPTCDREADDRQHTVLVIDDEAPIRDFARDILEKSGIKVFEAKDGTEGMATARAMRPDLIITDMVMPNKDGIEVISEIKFGFPDCGIIAMSGAAHAGAYLETAQSFGVHKVIQKPFTRVQLEAAVRATLALIKTKL